MSGHAEYVVWLQTYFWVVYIYIYMLVAANFVLQVAVVVSVFILFICFVSDFWDQMNLIC